MRSVFRRLSLPALLLSACLIPTSAAAAPIVWTFSDITHASGGTVAGSFIFDADTGIYSDVAVTMTLPDASFDTSDIEGASASPSFLQLIANFGAPDLTGQPTLELLIDGGPLTNAGGVVNFSEGLAGVCGNSNCSTISVQGGEFGGSIGGKLTGTRVDVAEPTTLLLLGSGLLGAGVRRSRKNRL